MSVNDGSDLPPVPPTVAPAVNLADPALGRHVAPEPGSLVASDGAPIGPTTPSEPFITRRGDLPASQLWVAEVEQNVAELDSRGADLNNKIRRVGRDILIVGVLAAVSLIVALAAGYLTLTDANTRNQDQRRQLRSDIQQAQINQQHRDAICTADTLLLGSKGTTARAEWAAGPAAYDRAIEAARSSSAELGCRG